MNPLQLEHHIISSQNMVANVIVRWMVDAANTQFIGSMTSLIEFCCLVETDRTLLIM